MKKAYCMNKYKKFYNFCICFTLCFFLFNGCGLYADIDAINSPTTPIFIPGYSNTDFQNNYFSFYTKNQGNENLNGVTFLGTDVYYRIYNNTSSLDSDISTLLSLVNSENNSASAPTRMISMGYVPLKIKNNPYKSPIISKAVNNQKVEIRLTDYQDSDEFAAKILLDNVKIGIPVRNYSESNISFNFGRKGEQDRLPDEKDEDVKYSTTATENGKWYVAMFAVGVGEDVNTYAPLYSNILYLGAVTIDSRDENN